MMLGTSGSRHLRDFGTYVAQVNWSYQTCELSESGPGPLVTSQHEKKVDSSRKTCVSKAKAECPKISAQKCRKSCGNPDTREFSLALLDDWDGASLALSIKSTKAAPLLFS